jgi:choline dehydrogenase-like flavoprotein
MSIINLYSVADKSYFETDICIVGSGPAGWTLAEELRDSRFRILMVESGGLAIDPKAEALNEIENVGTRVHNGRSRVLGGTNGRSMPFDEIDFEQRRWVPLSGWPFGATEMANYVDRAAAHLGSGPYYEKGERRALPKGLRRRPAVDPAHLHQACWETPPVMDFGQILSTRRHSNLRVLVQATVTHLNTDQSGRVIQSVEVTDGNGRRADIHAPVVVLCAGGVENARILLYSNRHDPAGVGNAHDVVGRYLMDHPRDFELLARVDPADADQFRDLFGPHMLDGVRGRHEFSFGFKLSPERQRAEQLLNAAAWPYEVIADSDPFEATIRLARMPRKTAFRDATLVMSQPGMLARGAYARLIQRQRVRRKIERIGFLVSSEQLPDPESRVQLSSRRDWLGLPVSKIDWRINEMEARSQAALAQTIASEFARLGLPRVRLAEWAREGNLSGARFEDGCHPTGTTRMSTDPRKGVVDENCQVHGVEGLFIAGSSVFPTGSHANPTLMILALAVRLADHLRQALAHRIYLVQERRLPSCLTIPDRQRCRCYANLERCRCPFLSEVSYDASKAVSPG